MIAIDRCIISILIKRSFAPVNIFCHFEIMFSIDLFQITYEGRATGSYHLKLQLGSATAVSLDNF